MSTPRRHSIWSQTALMTAIYLATAGNEACLPRVQLTTFELEDSVQVRGQDVDDSPNCFHREDRVPKEELAEWREKTRNALEVELTGLRVKVENIGAENWSTTMEGTVILKLDEQDEGLVFGPQTIEVSEGNTVSVPFDREPVNAWLKAALDSDADLRFSFNGCVDMVPAHFDLAVKAAFTAYAEPEY
ncbi:MAG: hypothetical protein AB2A00_01895 [Myxococcota bacterium]